MSMPGLHAVADLQFPRALHHGRDEPIVDRVFHDGAAGGGALLAGGEEGGVDHVLDGRVEVGVGQHDGRVLAAHLELDAQAALARPRRAASAPISQEPVKETAFSGLALTSASPSSPPEPATKLTTPLGMPASCSASTMRQALSGAADAGLSTTVLPQISAGASFHAGIALGKFHGVIRPTTPIGLRMREHVDAVALARAPACRACASLRRRSSGRC